MHKNYAMEDKVERIGIIIMILSHIASGLYMEKPKYNKFVTAGLWSLFAVFSLVMAFFFKDVQTGFFGIFFAHLIFFFISAKGPAGEKLFLFMTYANAFCINIGMKSYLGFLSIKPMFMLFLEVLIVLMTHIILYKFLLPVYNKAKIFFCLRLDENQSDFNVLFNSVFKPVCIY